MELEIDFLTSRISLQIASSYKYQLHQSLCIFKAGLSNLSDGWAKYKQKVPDMLDFNQNLETTCISKIKFAELKDFFIRRVPKN